MRILPILFLLTLPVLLPAQTQQWSSPRAYATKEASSSGTAPFGQTATHWRYQQLHADILCAPCLVTGLAWRRDGTSTSAFGAIAFEVRLDISNAAVGLNTFTGDYEGNHGPNRTTIIQGTMGPTSFLKINWPGTTHTTSPAPFAYMLPFKTPFSCVGKTLVWEALIKNLSGGSTTKPFDMASQDPAVGKLEWGGAPDPNTLEATLMNNYQCVATGQIAHAVPMVKGARSGNNWTLQNSTYSLPRNSSAFWIMGHSALRWGPLALPFTLPGTKCEIVTPPILVGPAIGTGNIGMGSAGLQFPHNSALTGMRLYTQWIALDTGKPQGVMLSRGVMLQFPLAAGFPPGLAKTVWGQTGLVTRFSLK